MRGYQRKVIFLKNTGSPYFDEAYFVMSDHGVAMSVDQSDMVREANRIINESLSDPFSRIEGERVKSKREFIFPFFLGVIISVLCFLILIFLYVLFSGKIG